MCWAATFLLAAFAALPQIGLSLANDYPTRTVRVIIPYSPGGSPDVLFRVVAQALSEKWGQSVVLENRAGGNTIIGTTAVARSEPDGYTLLFTADGTFLLNPLFYPSLPYSMSELSPITLVGTAPHMFAITKDAPAKNAQEFVAWAKAKPDTVMYGSTGPASLQRLAMEFFSHLTGIKLVHVPYKGAPETTTAVLTGEITASINSVATIMPHVAAGNMRTLGVAAAKRSPLAPDTPTIQEQGVAGFSSQGSFGLFGPAALPNAVRDKIQTDIAEILRRPEVKRVLEQRGFEVYGLDPAEFRKFIAVESEKWRRVIVEAKIKAE